MLIERDHEKGAVPAFTVAHRVVDLPDELLSEQDARRHMRVEPERGMHVVGVHQHARFYERVGGECAVLAVLPPLSVD